KVPPLRYLHWSGSMSEHRRVGLLSSLLSPRFWVIFLPLSLLTGWVVLVLYQKDVANERLLHEQAGAHLVDLLGNIITSELKTAESDLLYLANQAPLRSYLEAAKGEQEELQKELQNEYLLFSKQRRVYDQIRYLDASGQEKIRINYDDGQPIAVHEKELQNKADRYYFWRSMRLERGQVFISPFDLNQEHGKIEEPHKPTIRFCTPVFEGKTARGVLVLNYLGARLLDKLAQVSKTFPGRVLLLNYDGFFLRGPSAEDEWGFNLGHQRSFATYFPEEWKRVIQVGSGQFQTERGLFSVRGIFPGADLPAVSGWRTGDPDAGDPSLKVVSFTPAELLDRRSTLLLQRLLLLYGVILVVNLALAWYLAYAGAVRQKHERQLADSEARLRSLSTKLLTAQEDERRSLSRDLHDALGQVVTAVSLDLRRASQTPEVEKKNELVGRALSGTDSLLDRIHEISARVRPALLDDLGLKDAVQSLLSEFEHRTSIVPKTELRFDGRDVPAMVRDNVYRILQEALTNVSRHAKAAEVFVNLTVDGQKLDLTVRDPGVGFSPELLDGKRLGLLGMRERAELLDGTFSLKSEPQQGTEIRVTIPLVGKN
ncbi:MAG TPA: sensor histidine kinase, partial [Gemmataceae bacterium]|nr:sensor histidine kinase [Gemmataceae bacterium]